jgi:hypothetical protein
LTQICSDERRLKAEIVPLINTDNTDLNKLKNSMGPEERSLRAIKGEEPRVAVDRRIREFPEEPRNTQHGTWEEARAA